MNVTCIGPESHKYSEDDHYALYDQDLLKQMDQEVLLKEPSHSYAHLSHNRQTLVELISYDWSKAVGVGAVTGFNGLRVIDLQGCKTIRFLQDVLKILGLPKDYEWVVRTGGQDGFHILVQCEEWSLLNADKKVVFFWTKPDFKHLGHMMMLHWNSHVVLPPSMHKSGYRYAYLNDNPLDEFGLRRPERISSERLQALVDKFFDWEESGGHDRWFPWHERL